MVGKYRAIRLSRSAPGSSSLDQRVPFSYRSSFHGSPLRWYPWLSQKPGCVARVRTPLGGYLPRFSGRPSELLQESK